MSLRDGKSEMVYYIVLFARLSADLRSFFFLFLKKWLQVILRVFIKTNTLCLKGNNWKQFLGKLHQL